MIAAARRNSFERQRRTDSSGEERSHTRMCEARSRAGRGASVQKVCVRSHLDMTSRLLLSPGHRPRVHSGGAQRWTASDHRQTKGRCWARRVWRANTHVTQHHDLFSTRTIRRRVEPRPWSAGQSSATCVFRASNTI